MSRICRTYSVSSTQRTVFPPVADGDMQPLALMMALFQRCLQMPLVRVRKDMYYSKKVIPRPESGALARRTLLYPDTKKKPRIAAGPIFAARLLRAKLA